MRSVLIVGSGATGAAAAHALSGAVRAGQLTVSVWDKARGAGGRMNTTRRFVAVPPRRADPRRSPAAHSPFDDKVTADLGAQYLTRRKGDSPRVAAAYQELLDAGTIAPLRSTIRGDRGGDEVIANYTAPGGINRVVKHFLLAAVGAVLSSPLGAVRRSPTHASADGGVSTTFRRTVVGVSPEAGDSGPGWRVHAADGATERFDAVILTVPAPQLLTLGGEWKDRLDRPAVGASGQPLPSTATVREVLKSTRFSSRYAVALFYRDPRALDAIGDWGGHYVDGDECLRFASRDCVKRGLMPEGGASQQPCLDALVHGTLVSPSTPLLQAARLSCTRLCPTAFGAPTTTPRRWRRRWWQRRGATSPPCPPPPTGPAPFGGATRRPRAQPPTRGAHCCWTRRGRLWRRGTTWPPPTLGDASPPRTPLWTPSSADGASLLAAPPTRGLDRGRATCKVVQRQEVASELDSSLRHSLQRHLGALCPVR